MADQGQPLMTVPQTNLWGQAGDDLRTILANREVQRRKDLLESIQVQGDLQKQAIAGNESASKLATEQQNRQIAGAKAPADLAHLQAQTTGLDDAHAEAVAKQETRVALGNAMDAFDAATTPEERVKAAAHIKAHGGSLMTDAEVQALNAPSHEEAIQKLILAYGQEKDPDKRQQIGMQMMNLGAKGVPTPDATPYSSFGNGGLYDARNAHVIQPPLPPAAADQGQQTTKNYQVVKNEVDKVRTQYTANLPRMERLEATLKEATPQADALVAPELLTVMAGGQGSGLRMNEAEISRIVGGRNVWQNLKSNMLRLQTNPNAPFLLPPEQRQQVDHLIQAVKSKAQDRLNEIQIADDKLLKANSVDEQRQIFVDLQKAVEGTAEPSGNTPPPGAKVEHWVIDPATGKLVKGGG